VQLCQRPPVNASEALPPVVSIWDYICQGVGFAADGVTLVLGALALWALVFHKRKIALVVNVLLSSFLNERIKRTKETLGKLESLSFDNKDDRAEIVALMGQLSGQIKPFIAANSDLAGINHEIREIVDRKTRLNEATKRRLTYEMHGALDNISFIETRAILETRNDGEAD
jgi:hypothetical protein